VREEAEEVSGVSATRSVRVDTAAVVRQLWPPSFSDTSVFALLDGARDRRIEPMIRESELEAECLYAGDLTRRLRAAAPHIVRLEPTSELLEAMLTDGWSQSWGVFALGWRGATLARLKRHFRQFLRAKDEAGNVLIFRFYDPRVLRVYLPTCTAEEARAFFGPVDMFLMEGDRPDRLMAYSRSPKGVKAVTVDLPAKS
jgi:hypothetical protein